MIRMNIKEYITGYNRMWGEVYRNEKTLEDYPMLKLSEKNEIDHRSA